MAAAPRRRPRRIEESEDAIFDSPFGPGTEEFEEHELYMQMLADRDQVRGRPAIGERAPQLQGLVWPAT
jgi:hypothetical protein